MTSTQSKNMVGPDNLMYELASERNKLQAAWNRQILTIASGGLALLVGMKPEIPVDVLGKSLLVAAWSFLGIGILSGGAATYAEVSLAKELAQNLAFRLQRCIDEGRPLSDVLKDGPVTARATRITRYSCRIMVWSLMGAVVSFVAYSIRQILAA